MRFVIFFLAAGWLLLSQPQASVFPGNIAAKYQRVPVLCYHNIRVHPPVEDELWIKDTTLKEQLKMLADSGYCTILPEDLYRHIRYGTLLPKKSIIISFDDGHLQHYTIASKLLSIYHFKAVFFVSTLYIGRKGQMGSAEIKALADSGHTIGCHTYDHPDLKLVHGNEWYKEIDSSSYYLERITGKPVKYFAYPYGIWSDSAIAQLDKAGFKAAFQLTGKGSTNHPLFTLRRIAVSGQWSPVELYNRIQQYFEQ